MIPADEARLARVERVVAAGRRAADAADPLGRETRAALFASSGLSAEGVALALGAHLETHPAPHHVAALVAGAGRAPHCHVVLAANVCTAALRALAVAVATAPRVSLRPSRRDPVLARILVRALAEDPLFAAAGGAVACVEAINAAAGDELHVHGSDATVRAVSSSAAPFVIVRGHGTGLGVAVVARGDAIDHVALAVARDVIPFDQRGCLSPRAVLVEGDALRAEAFARALHAALVELSIAVPRGPLDAGALAEIALYRASIQAIGEIWEGPGHVVGLDPSPRALVLPPAARVVHVVPAGDVEGLLGPWAGYLTSVGADVEGGLASAVLALAPGARRARLGEMQRPPLDGPVDRRPSASGTCRGGRIAKYRRRRCPALRSPPDRAPPAPRSPPSGSP